MKGILFPRGLDEGDRVRLLGRFTGECLAAAIRRENRLPTRPVAKINAAVLDALVEAYAVKDGTWATVMRRPATR
ncbi:hypothetical protein AB0D54_37125 [Streptomyces xanthophaeus]|uniref:hypothetical protein n=1 Tax=Streptomyces xanthophaeus TaxID=67385 RepID=UPI00342E2B38